MIKTETVVINDKEFTHTWSDEHKYICRDDQQWEDAYDPINIERTYTEGDPIDEPEEEPTAEKILNILLGENND